MIYLIHPDYQLYKSFVLDNKVVRKALGSETLFHFSRAPQSYLDGWQPFEIGFAALGVSEKAAMPDIMVRNGRLFLTAPAFAALGGLLEKHGEFLPVTYGGKDGHLFNVLSLAESVKGIDTKLSTKNEFGEVQSLAFHEDKVKGLLLFRTAFDGYMGIYCTEGFKAAIDESNFKGLIFSNDIGSIFPPDADVSGPSSH